MHSFRIITVFVIISALLAACGVTRRGAGFSTSSTRNAKAIETGVASWYGPNFHGKLTANGETYDMDGMTAAHRTLPFESVVLVENLDNGKSIQVRINDRGPFAKDRIIDLSREAAKRIGMIGPGTARVRLYLLKGDLKNSRVTDLKVANYTIQLGSFKKMEQARKHASDIDDSRVETIWVGNDRFYRVYYGKYTDPEKAKDDLRKLKRNGHNGFVKQVEND